MKYQCTELISSYEVFTYLIDRGPRYVDTPTMSMSSIIRKIEDVKFESLWGLPKCTTCLLLFYQ